MPQTVNIMLKEAVRLRFGSKLYKQFMDDGKTTRVYEMSDEEAKLVLSRKLPSGIPFFVKVIVKGEEKPEPEPKPEVVENVKVVSSSTAEVLVRKEVKPKPKKSRLSV